MYLLTSSWKQALYDSWYGTNLEWDKPLLCTSLAPRTKFQFDMASFPIQQFYKSFIFWTFSVKLSNIDLTDSYFSTLKKCLLMFAFLCFKRCFQSCNNSAIGDSYHHRSIVQVAQSKVCFALFAGTECTPIPRDLQPQTCSVLRMLLLESSVIIQLIL